MADRRVKLVFVDELGRLLLRKRGFSSCWFLVPTSAKIVGDLVHEIRHEFGLSVVRCPSGVDLVLEKLHLLPSHDIRIVRDNDEICVQCSSHSDGGESAGSRRGALGAIHRQNQQLVMFEVSDFDDEELQLQQTKRKMRSGKKEPTNEATIMREEVEKKPKKQEVKKSKRAEKTRKPVAKDSDSSDESSSSDSDADEDKQQRSVAAAKQTKKRKVIPPPVENSDSSSSSSSSSSSDSSDSSSSSDSEDEEKQLSKIALQPERKRQRVETKTTLSTPRQALKAAVPAKKPGATTSKANGEGEPRQRRRRRPRNRKPREERAKRPSENGAAAATAVVAIRSTVLPTAPGDRLTVPTALLPPPVAQRQQNADAPAIPQSTDPTSAAIVKGHVRFGDAGESQVVQRTSAASNGTTSGNNGGDVLSIRKPRAYVSPELQKYGPQHNASNGRGHQQQQLSRSASERNSNGNQNQQPRQQTNDHRTNDPVSARALQDDAVNPLTNGGSKNKKAKWDNLWKRPYEIVATIHDQPEGQSDEAEPSDVRSKVAF